MNKRYRKSASLVPEQKKKIHPPSCQFQGDRSHRWLAAAWWPRCVRPYLIRFPPSSCTYPEAPTPTVPRADWPVVFIEKETDREELSSPTDIFCFSFSCAGRTEKYGDLELEGTP